MIFSVGFFIFLNLFRSKMYLNKLFGKYGTLSYGPGKNLIKKEMRA